MYIVGEIDENGVGWDFCGVFSTEDKALERCHNENIFISRVTLDRHEPMDRVNFEYAYYPLLEDKPNEEDKESKSST